MLLWLSFVATASIWLVLIYFTFPEIKGLTIEEISLVFDQGRLGNKADAIKEIAGDATIKDEHHYPTKDVYDDQHVQSKV